MKRVIVHKRFSEFFSSLKNMDDKSKIARAIDRLKIGASCNTKPLVDGIFELKVTGANVTYRVLFIYDRGDIVVLLSGFIKKSQKTPKVKLH
ncbi:MAG: type II toxin-antitoxin system RelE/ParE family toxin [Bacteroidales bacterium]|nr:type II toxin-antitoxin system RelE/ParE family toxin [Bacteroidales bacterium]